jgi:hypothetical protein
MTESLSYLERWNSAPNRVHRGVRSEQFLRQKLLARSTVLGPLFW